MIPVVDVFAGPGGLNEGFSSVRRGGEPVFDVAASFEMEPNAVETLVLRSAVRRLSRDGELFPPYRRFLAGDMQWEHLVRDEPMALALAEARLHVHLMELGPLRRDAVAARIESALGGAREWVLIGGPPCQAYSLVGRSRRTNDPTFTEDKKHFLYREYLDIIRRFKPAVFVMENVKGLLSAGHSGLSMFDLIMTDLTAGGSYEVRSLVVPDGDPRPQDFVVRSENYGVPQRRHRVILLGIKSDLRAAMPSSLATEQPVTVAEAIGGMSVVRPYVTRTSRRQDLALEEAVQTGLALAARELGSSSRPRRELAAMPAGLASWLTPQGVPISQHEPRGHMEMDLVRYVFLAALAESGRSLRVFELPAELRPQHKNVRSQGTPFVDRFKVQRWDSPSSTIASHISKDGHYYIHPDPRQSRSLTVREAARLQTFPDDYYFRGPRTMQYHQIGNAVPPMLAQKIAVKVAEILGG